MYGGTCEEYRCQRDGAECFREGRRLAGQGDAVPITLALKPSTEKTAVSSASLVNVLVTPVDDDRSDRTRLGVHQSLWDTTKPLTMKDGMVWEVTAKALAEYLTRKGWLVQYVPTGSRLTGGDVVISGKILEASADAHGTVGSTDITAKNKIVVQAKNLSDGSSITDTISHTGTYSAFWYEPGGYGGHSERSHGKEFREIREPDQV